MDAIRFTCQKGCLNYCEQKGNVHLTEDDLKRAEAKYVYRTRHEMRFRKPRNQHRSFLEGHGCSIHPAKPTQCRMFPFWPEVVERKATGNHTASCCPGIGKGPLIQTGTAMETAEEQRPAYPEMYK